MLLNAGAGVNAQGGEYGNAQRAASYRGHKTVVHAKFVISVETSLNPNESDREPLSPSRVTDRSFVLESLTMSRILAGIWAHSAKRLPSCGAATNKIAPVCADI